jgi:hypothetical protein
MLPDPAAPPATSQELIVAVEPPPKEMEPPSLSQTIVLLIVLDVLERRRMPYPAFAVNVESSMMFVLPVIWIPSGLFSATTQLSSVMPPAAA